jgi:poly(hydroxyalkanoate) granule-associated protein
MATRKTTRTRTRTTARRQASPRGAADVLRETWDSALASLTSAQAEIEKQVRALVNGKGGDAAESLRQLGQRLEKERRKVAREIETRVASLQARVQKERRSLSRVVDEGVRGALAALNIPSRQEINDLTRKVDELSRKIDGFSARPARRPATRKAKTVAHA